MDGWVCYLNEGNLFIKYYKYIDGVEYFDFGCFYEIYIIDFMFEMEILSLFYIVEFGEEIFYFEVW